MSQFQNDNATNFRKLGVFLYSHMFGAPTSSKVEREEHPVELSVATLYQNPESRAVKIMLSAEALLFLEDAEEQKFVRRYFSEAIFPQLQEGRRGEQGTPFFNSAHELVEVPELLPPQVSGINPADRFSKASIDALCVTVETLTDNFIHLSFRPSEYEEGEAGQ